MEEKFKVVNDEELQTEEIKKEEKETAKKENKNSVILIFSILGAIVFMLLIIASVFFLVPFLSGKKIEPTIKRSVDVKDVKSEYRMSSNSLENFDLTFLKLENNGKNKVYSPLSIKYALAMLSEGSSGTTKAQIDAIIGDYKSKKYPNNEHMSFANAMFIRNTFKNNINDSYTKTLAEKYNAEVKLDEFKNADNLNNWVSGKTFKLINNMFDSDDVKSLDFVLINALAIDMNWNNQLQCATGSKVPCKRYNITYNHEKRKGEDYKFGDYVSSIYRDEDYHSLTFNGKENIKSADVKAAINNYDIVKELGENKIREEVGAAYKKWIEANPSFVSDYFPADVNKYMDKYIAELKENYGRVDYSTDFMIYDDNNVKAFAKDLKTYDNTTLQYVGIMPKNEELNKYIENVTPEDINSVINNLKTIKKENFKEGVVTLIHGYIPMFDYEYDLDFMKDLQKLGITDVFDINKADLSVMLKKDTNEYISYASHKAKIEFSNDGIKAAAVTAAGGEGSTGAGFEYLLEIPIEEIDITFDKPFMYIIRDKATGEVWFTGSVYEPKTK